MSKRPKYKLGFCPLLAGDTLACRYTHMILTHEKMRPETHCFHMGPGLPDPDGKVKCHDSECGPSMEGPIECGSETCDGTLPHAGVFCDWLNFAFWFSFCLCAVGYCLVVDHRRNLILRTKAQLSVSMQQKADEVLHTLNRAYPIAFGAAWVFGFEAFVFLLCASMRDDLRWLWRPWPSQAMAPRYSEYMSRSSDHGAEYDFGGRWGAEGVFSNCNQCAPLHLCPLPSSPHNLPPAPTFPICLCHAAYRYMVDRESCCIRTPAYACVLAL